MMETKDLACDLLVIGAGMAGLTTAAVAAEGGARVIVVEKGREIGGTAALSGGYIWTLRDINEFREIDPGGDHDLQRVILDEFDAVIDRVRSLGVFVSKRLSVLDGEGYQVDIMSYLNRCCAIIEANEGYVVRNARVHRLVLDRPGSVVGANLSDDTMSISVSAPWTVLATGGFAAGKEFVARFIGEVASQLPVRASGLSTGDGLRLAVDVGAASSQANSGFYGHLVPYPGQLEDRDHLHEVSLFNSSQGVLVDRQGRRYVDESRGDHFNAEATLVNTGPQALLVWDDVVNEKLLAKSFTVPETGEDKYLIAKQAGAQCTRSDRLEEIASFAQSCGFDGPGILETLREFNESIVSGRELKPGRVNYRWPVSTSPFSAIVAQPAITSTYAGIAVDTEARVLASNLRSPITGLLAAGTDVGDVFAYGYGGGLSLAGAFGLRAARTGGFNRVSK